MPFPGVVAADLLHRIATDTAEHPERNGFVY
jgi:hypothetical protein